MAARVPLQSAAKALVRASAARGRRPHHHAQGPPYSVDRSPQPRPVPPRISPSLEQLKLVAVHLFSFVKRRMTTWDWDKRIAPWMYGSLHDPEIVFHRLKLEDKEVLQLVQLMVTESIEKVNAQHGKGVELIVVELIKVSDAQSEQQLLMQWFAVSAATTSLCIYLEYNKMKSRIIDLSTNLAAHSAEILSEVIQAGKHEGPWFLGKGKPWEWNWEWLQPKDGGKPNDGPEKK